MNLGTIQTDGDYAYDPTKNPLLVKQVTRVTVAPFGRPQINDHIDTSEYATVEAAVAFAGVLHADRLVDLHKEEAATFTASYPKYGLVFGEKRVNAGALASILGNDPAYGMNDGAKAGFIAKELGEQYDAAVHIPLVRELRKAVGA